MTSDASSPTDRVAAAAPAPDIDAALGRARMLFSMLSAPKLRAAIGERLAGRASADGPAFTDGPVSTAGPTAGRSATDPATTGSDVGPLSRIDWLRADGEVDVPTIRATVDALTLLRSSEVILQVPRLEVLPPQEQERLAVSGRIARMVFERLGPDRVLSESELNAAIAMIAPDVALVRRDAVDTGVLTRTADGAQYRLADPERA